MDIFTSMNTINLFIFMLEGTALKAMTRDFT